MQSVVFRHFMQPVRDLLHSWHSMPSLMGKALSKQTHLLFNGVELKFAVELHAKHTKLLQSKHPTPNNVQLTHSFLSVDTEKPFLHVSQYNWSVIV